MSLSLDSTVGGAASNSYGVIADVNTVAPFRPTVGAAWLAASGTPDVQTQAAAMATQRIDQLRFAGEPSSDSQALQFPRVNLNDRYRRPIDSASIPRAVMSAWISLSMWYVYQLSLNAALDPLATGDTQSIKTATAGDASVEYFAPAAVADSTSWNDVSDLPPDVVRFLNQFLALDPMAVSIASGWGQSKSYRTS